MTRVLSYTLKLPLLRQADGLGFQEEAAGLHPWELCMMEQAPGLAWQELQESVRKGATEKTLTPISLSVSQTAVLLVDYSHMTELSGLYLMLEDSSE